MKRTGGKLNGSNRKSYSTDSVFQDGIDWRNYVMILVAFIFLYLAIKKGYEPLLLLPIAFGMLLANIYPLIIQMVDC